MRAEIAPLETLDVIDPAVYGRHGYPHAAWARLRREAPVFRMERPDFDPFWAITRHEDVVRISRSPHLFLNAPRLAMMPNSVRPAQEVRGDPNWRNPLRTLLHMDGDDHRSYRRLAVPWFRPRAIARLEPRVRAVARRLVAEFGASAMDAPADFVTRVAARLPLAVISHLLGVPEQDEDLVLRLSTQGVGAADPEYRRHGASARESRRAATLELFAYFSAMIEDRRARPREDLATHLAHATVRGTLLPTAELLSYFGLIAVAGHETTRNAASGGLAALCERDPAWQRLQGERALVADAVEEIVRFTSPVVQFARTAARDTEIRGQRIRAGDALVLFYPSANRDEQVFEEPDRFRIDRVRNPHLAFGIGEHFCLGAHLARLELRVLFEEMLVAWSRVELAGPVEYLASSLVGGIKHLPVRVRTAD